MDGCIITDAASQSLTSSDCGCIDMTDIMRKAWYTQTSYAPKLYQLLELLYRDQVQSSLTFVHREVLALSIINGTIIQPNTRSYGSKVFSQSRDSLGHSFRTQENDNIMHQGPHSAAFKELNQPIMGRGFKEKGYASGDNVLSPKIMARRGENQLVIE